MVFALWYVIDNRHKQRHLNRRRRISCMKNAKQRNVANQPV